ncbi:hypothetical protein QTH90_10785 [Variovorax sp. J2P1-59]|uniref:hypothetical protein n=1 Tax=Variovorax flavidus TaxID=3053501 RepID=UPI00257736C9|nr:hypothetical protein [Variovorax sp. J2P1-59]MDM0074868.1 hypothetical protein [Variovorax sp. J2P1-59]
MISQGFDTAPTVADEVSAVVDDAQVIAKTLPAKLPRRAHTLTERLDHALDATCEFVNRQPMQAVVIAAAASSLLTMVLTRRPRSGNA